MNLSRPVDLCLSPDGRELFVVDDECIQVLNAADGSHNRTIGSFGEDNGEFNFPFGICVSHDGEELYVADRDNNRVQVLRSHDGSHIRTFEDFSSPKRVCLSPDGRELFVSDFSGIHVLRIDGTKILTIEKGRGHDRFTLSDDVCFSLDGSHFFVADGNRVKVFRTDDKTYVRFIGGATKLTGFTHAESLCISPVNGNLFVSDSGHNHIQIYTPDGQHVRRIGGGGPNINHFGYRGGGDGPGEFDMPMGICISLGGNELFVADARNTRVQIFHI